MFRDIAARRIASRLSCRGFATSLEISALSKNVQPHKGALCLSGFPATFQPTIGDIWMLLLRSQRTSLASDKKDKMKASPDPAEVFEDVSTYVNSNGSSDTIVSLKKKCSELSNTLPMARNLDVPEFLFDDQLRYSWSGALVPVLNGKILWLSEKYKNRSAYKKNRFNIKWYRIMFRNFEPDVLEIKNTNKQLVLDVLKKAHGDFTVKERAESDQICKENSIVEFETLLRFKSSSDAFAMKKKFICCWNTLQAYTVVQLPALETFSGGKATVPWT